MKNLFIFLLILNFFGLSAQGAQLKMTTPDPENNYCSKDVLRVAKFLFRQNMQAAGEQGDIIENSIKFIAQDELNGTTREHAVSASDTTGSNYIVKVLTDGCSVVRVTIDFK